MASECRVPACADTHTGLRADVLRRFTRSWTNFREAYRLLCDAWAVYDNSGNTPRLLELGP
jgi:predicted ABC-type ATPase